MVKLSKTQINVLKQAINGSRLNRCYRTDRTMRALERYGFATFTSQLGTKYGKDYWWITDAGMDWAKNNLKEA